MQTGDAVREGYGFGWSTSARGCGHGGAYATHMNLDRERGLITVFMVQHAGFPPEGARSAELFKQAAGELYGSQP